MEESSLRYTCRGRVFLGLLLQEKRLPQFILEGVSLPWARHVAVQAFLDNTRRERVVLRLFS